MGFSDEELERLKEQVKKRVGEDDFHINEETGNWLEDLIHRLECAERAAQFMYISAHPIDEASEEAYQEWRNSKSEPKDKGEGR